MAAQLALHLKALATFLDTVQSTSAFGDVVKQQKLHFSQQLSTMSLSVSDANEIISALRSAPWPADILNTMLAEVASKTTAGGGGMPHRLAMQDFKHMSVYLPAKLWTILQADSELTSKIELLLQHACNMGLRTPSEPTFQALTGILLGAHEGVTEAINKCSQSKYAVYTSMKSMFKKTQQGLGVTSWIHPLPATIAEFRAKYPEAFAQIFSSDPPSTCPLDSIGLKNLIDSVPMRKTHRQVSQSLKAVAVASDASSMMMQMWQMMMQQQQHLLQQPQGGTPLNIQFLKPNIGGQAVDSGHSDSSRSSRSAEQKPKLALAPPPPQKDEELNEEEEEEQEKEEEEKEEEENTKKPEEQLEARKHKGTKYKGPKKSVEETLALIQRQMRDRQPKAKGKAKGTGKAKGKGSSKGLAKAKGSSKGLAKAKGCSKCRWSANGCAKCKK